MWYLIKRSWGPRYQRDIQFHESKMNWQHMAQKTNKTKRRTTIHQNTWKVNIRDIWVSFIAESIVVLFSSLKTKWFKWYASWKDDIFFSNCYKRGNSLHGSRVLFMNGEEKFSNGKTFKLYPLIRYLPMVMTSVLLKPCYIHGFVLLSLFIYIFSLSLFFLLSWHYKKKLSF